MQGFFRWIGDLEWYKAFVVFSGLFLWLVVVGAIVFGVVSLL